MGEERRTFIDWWTSGVNVCLFVCVTMAAMTSSCAVCKFFCRTLSFYTIIQLFSVAIIGIR